MSCRFEMKERALCCLPKCANPPVPLGRCWLRFYLAVGPTHISEDHALERDQLSLLASDPLVGCAARRENCAVRIRRVMAGRVTRGPRAEGSPEVEISSADVYFQVMVAHHVVVEREARRAEIASRSPCWRRRSAGVCPTTPGYWTR